MKTCICNFVSVNADSMDVDAHMHPHIRYWIQTSAHTNHHLSVHLCALHWHISIKNSACEKRYMQVYTRSHSYIRIRIRTSTSAHIQLNIQFAHSYPCKSIPLSWSAAIKTVIWVWLRDFTYWCTRMRISANMNVYCVIMLHIRNLRIKSFNMS